MAKTTYLTLATLTSEQKALLDAEQIEVLTGLEGKVTKQSMHSLINSMLKGAAKIKENAIKEAERQARKEAKIAENEAKYAERNLFFGVEDERNKLDGMVICRSKKFGTEVVFPKGHDNNAAVILRTIEGTSTRKDGQTTDYEMVFDTKNKRTAKNAALVRNNKKLVSSWILEAVERFPLMADLTAFLEKQVNAKGEKRFNSLDLDILNEAQQAGDKTSARLAKKYGEYFTIKSL